MRHGSTRIFPLARTHSKQPATDNSGATASATVTVTTNVPPYVVLTSPANCSVIIGPANVTLAADALDTDGSIAHVDFYQGSTLLGTATGCLCGYVAQCCIGHLRVHCCCHR
jgi:hypothetical protein